MSYDVKDGKVSVIRHSDGTIREFHKDGRVIMKFPKGAPLILYPNGTYKEVGQLTEKK